MRVAFHAPLKPPHHPTPSGDRLMARALIGLLEDLGHSVILASGLRTYLRDPDDSATAVSIAEAARTEVARLAAEWRRGGAPDLWISYHPYYKSPDLIGPVLSRRFGLPYVTVESSCSARRDIGLWRGQQDLVRAGLRQAAVNICLTARDRDGIVAEYPGARVAMLPPFIDAAAFGPPRSPAKPGAPVRLATVAMMRTGDKMDSYRLLADAVAALPVSLAWRLTIVGDGPARDEVRTLFAPVPPGRLTWAGALDRAAVAQTLAMSDILVWPGSGEAYGIAYLEAQASGLPVVAMRVAGVPEVVADGETGLLSDPGDADALAASVVRLASDPALRARMGAAATARVALRHSLTAAAVRLRAILDALPERAR